MVCNGDFESGNTQFESASSYLGNNNVPGAYGVSNTPTTYNFCSVSDHTVTTGSLFWSNDLTFTPSRVYWRYSGAPILVQSGRTYRFRAYLSTVTPLGPFVSPRLQFQVSLNGGAWVVLGNSPDMSTGGLVCPGWSESFDDYTPTTSGYVGLRLVNVQSLWTNWAIDDIFFGLSTFVSITGSPSISGSLSASSTLARLPTS